MKFELDAVATRYQDQNEVKQLKDLGFKFTEINETNIFGEKDNFLLEHPLPEINFDTIEQLVDFVNKHGSIIIARNNRITIYNDYM